MAKGDHEPMRDVSVGRRPSLRDTPAVYKDNQTAVSTVPPPAPRSPAAPRVSLGSTYRPDGKLARGQGGKC